MNKAESVKLSELGPQKSAEDFCVVQCGTSVFFRGGFARIARLDRITCEVFEQIAVQFKRTVVRKAMP